MRRFFLFLRESIDEGTQWVVFEPNDPTLWGKIRLNVTAFLTNVWRSGALFGVTPQEAFYVKCDAETNPPEVRDVGHGGDRDRRGHRSPGGVRDLPDHAVDGSARGLDREFGRGREVATISRYAEGGAHSSAPGVHIVDVDTDPAEGDRQRRAAVRRVRSARPSGAARRR